MGSGERLALCLHGFPEHAYSWHHQMPMLAEQGYRVWAPNLRGYGNTDSPRQIDAYRLETLVADVMALIGAAGAKETLLLGHDWGGALAWLVAMDHPAMVERVIICNLPHPACFLRELKRPVQFLKSWYVLLFQVPWLPELLLGAFHAQGVARVIGRSAQNRSRLPLDVLRVYRDNACRPGGLTAMLNWYRAGLRRGGMKLLERKTYPEINIPTLLLWGDADVALSIRTTVGTDKYVRNLTFRVLHGVSHWIQQEAPEAVNGIIAAWLEGRHVPEYGEFIASSQRYSRED
jgi:pimeloyl-ACP methyl ester carboxylesterase